MATPHPPKTNAAESETVTEERKMKPWSKPVIRHIGQTVYTRTGSNPRSGGEHYNYQPATS